MGRVINQGADTATQWHSEPKTEALKRISLPFLFPPVQIAKDI
jgi:hypothetical protein